MIFRPDLCHRDFQTGLVSKRFSDRICVKEIFRPDLFVEILRPDLCQRDI
jgi:hypothetical protein